VQKDGVVFAIADVTTEVVDAVSVWKKRRLVRRRFFRR
jgi:hypothetical protein